MQPNETIEQIVQDKIVRCTKNIAKAKSEIESLIIALAGYLNIQNPDRRQQVTMAVAINHFKQKITNVEDRMFELKQDLEQFTIEAQGRQNTRPPKRTIEQLDAELKINRNREKRARSII